MATNPPEPTLRKGGRAARSSRPEMPAEAAASLEDALSRAEEVLRRLNDAVADAESRLDAAHRDAERTIAAADELRQDVSSLIVALQGLAAEVDAQVREHTVALMRTMSGAGAPSEAAAAQMASATMAEEVANLIEELRGTAEEISADLEARSGELRELIEQATRPRTSAPVRRAPADIMPAPARRVSADVPSPAVRRATPEAPAAPTAFGGRASAGDDDEPLPSVSERARSVQDQFEPSRRSRTQDYGRYAEAMDLAASGVSADDIARRCGLGREEVRMLLRLRQSDSGRR